MNLSTPSVITIVVVMLAVFVIVNLRRAVRTFDRLDAEARDQIVEFRNEAGGQLARQCSYPLRSIRSRPCRSRIR